MTSQPLDGNRPLYWKADKTVFTLRNLFYVLAGLLFIAIHVKLSQFAFDDAYIHFRVARNLLDLGTPYFNAHEMVKVSTSSGWTVFLAFLLFLSRLMGMENNFQNVVSITNGFITLTGMLIFSGTIEQLSGSLNASSKLFFQVSYLALLAGASAGLMEVPLALLFVGLGIRNILKLKLSGFFWLALATYIRLELGILLVVVGIYSILQKRSDFWKIAFYTTLGILPFLAYDMYFFHTIIPHSIVAKSVVYSIVPLQTFTRGLLLAFPLIVSNHQLFYFVAVFILVLCILFSIVATLVLNPKSNMKTWIAIFSVWALGIFASYIAGRTLIFEWYTPLYTVPMLLAVTLCANRKSFPRNGLSTEIRLVLFIISLAVLVQFFIGAWIDPGQYIQFESGSRVKTYLEVGKKLNEEYPGAVLLSSKIGGLGYAFRGRVLDAAGLASADALEFHPMKIPEQRSRGDLGGIPPLYVEKYRPELIVSYDQFAQALLDSNGADQYNIVVVPAYLPQDKIYAKRETLWGDRFLRIYIRKDLPVSKEILKLGIN